MLLAVRPQRSLSIARGYTLIQDPMQQNKLSRLPEAHCARLLTVYWGAKSVSTRARPTTDLGPFAKTAKFLTIIIQRIGVFAWGGSFE